jgi:hypothetical protein
LFLFLFGLFNLDAVAATNHVERNAEYDKYDGDRDKGNDSFS